MFKPQDLWTFIAITCVFLWLVKRWRDRHYILLSTKKGFTPIWSHIITGFGWYLTSKGTVSTCNEAHKKYGPNIVVYIGPFPILLTTDPGVIKDVWSSKECTTKPGLFYDRMANALGRGYITMSDPHWTNERKIVNPAFNNKNLMSFIPIFNEEVNRVLQNIDKDISKKLNTPLVIHFREFTVRIATRTTFGRIIDHTNFSSRKFSEAMNEILEYVGELTFNYIYAIGIIRKIAHMTIFKRTLLIHESLKSLITESFHGFSNQREMDSSYDTSIKTAIEYMIKGVEQNRMKSEYVTSDMVHIFAGAFETTSTSLFYILLMLGMHPEYQQRAYEEVCNLFPDADDGQFEVTYEDIGQMIYLDMIMNETMRVLPIIPQAAREVGRDLTLSNGVVLHKGQCVAIDIYSLHRSKRIWGPDADKFNPDNFLPSNIEAKHPFSFIPFTKGLRFCIGWRYAQLSIKVTMAKLIKRYKFSTNCKLEDLHLENHITSQLQKDPPLIVERRKLVKSV